MRIVSLVPAGTEIVAALGASELLVGISHECDWPSDVLELPRVTSTPISSSDASGSIDAAVQELVASGQPVITVDADQLRRLAPDLILTQGLCAVCAADDDSVTTLAASLPSTPRVVSLTATSVSGIERDVQAVACALAREDEGWDVIRHMRRELQQLRADAPASPARVVCVEWLDPLFLAGHWVPELVAAAGGVDVGAPAGRHSRRVGRDEFIELDPDIVVVMLCGFGVERSLRELAATALPETKAPVWVLDANAFTSRPGPRVVDGARRLHAALRGAEMPGLVQVTIGPSGD